MKQFFTTFFCIVGFSITVSSQTDKDSLVYDFARKLETSFYENDDTFFKSHFNNSAFLRNIFDGFIEPSDLSEYFKKNKIEHYRFRDQYYKIIQDIFSNEGEFNYVNYYSDRFNNYYLIFRLDQDETINYHEFYLDLENDEISISDIFIYFSGQILSSSFQEILIPTFTAFDGGEITALDSTVLFSYPHIQKANNLKAQGKLDEAIAYFNENISSDLFKENKLILLNYIQLLEIDDESDEYLNAITLLLELYPNNVTSWLMGIDFHILNEDYDKSLQSVDSLYQATGDDYLNKARGAIYLLKNDNETALKHYKQFITDFPYTASAYDSFIYAACELKNHDELMWLSQQTKDNYDLTYTAIAEIYKESCPDFYNSKKFQDWLPDDDNYYNLKGTFLSEESKSYDASMKMELNEPGKMIFENLPDMEVALQELNLSMKFKQTASPNKVETSHDPSNHVLFKMLINGAETIEVDTATLAGKRIVYEKDKQQVWHLKNKQSYDDEELEELMEILNKFNTTSLAEKENFSPYRDSIKVGESWEISEADLFKYFESDTEGSEEVIGKMTFNEIIERDGEKFALVNFIFESKKIPIEDYDSEASCDCDIERSLKHNFDNLISCDCDLLMRMEEEGQPIVMKFNSSIYIKVKLLDQEK